MKETNANQEPRIGVEIELFTIDNNGKITNGADKILSKIKSSNTFYIKKECATNIIEIASKPFEKVPNTISNIIEYLDEMIDVSKKDNIQLLPLGTHPGEYAPYMRRDEKYIIQQRLFGRKRWNIAGRVTGFHCHYTLPHGIFDNELRIIKMIANMKIKESLVNGYNFSIAADPAFSCFMQSSPYYQGRFLGKDSRIIMYRGGENLRNPEGLYSKFEEFGNLQNYKPTSIDIIDLISSRYENWKTKMMKIGVNMTTLSLYRSILDTSWNPVKINANGTLEQRGMDMNHIRNTLSMSIIIKTIMKQLQSEKYSVTPSEIGIDEPFKIEDDKIYIPPSSYVRKELQYHSAYKGFDDKRVYEYSKKLLEFSKKFIPKEKSALIKPFEKMIDEKKTVSDEIISYVDKKGHLLDEKIPNSLAQEIALYHSLKLEKDLDKTRKIIEGLII